MVYYYVCIYDQHNAMRFVIYVLLILFSFVIYSQIFNLFMMFWLVNFVVALGQMTLAGAFASYYWAFEKPRDIPAFPILSSLWRCFRYIRKFDCILYSSDMG